VNAINGMDLTKEWDGFDVTHQFLPGLCCNSGTTPL